MCNLPAQKPLNNWQLQWYFFFPAVVNVQVVWNIRILVQNFTWISLNFNSPPLKLSARIKIRKLWILPFWFCAGFFFFSCYENAWEERINPSAGYLFHRVVPWQAVSQGQWLSGFFLTKRAAICAIQVAAFSLPRAGAVPVVSATCVGKQVETQQILASPACQADSLG